MIFKSFSIVAATTAFGSASAFVGTRSPSLSSRSSSAAESESVSLHETKADLEVLANKLNPIVGFYDPMNLAEGNFWDQSNEATIGFLRQAEIKHGRVAMAAFVGYCIQSNYVFGWSQSLSGALPPSSDLQPEEQWDLIDINAKWQIFTVIGFLEIWDEMGGYGDTALPHYMKGRQPGKYPTFDEFRKGVHWVPDLYDPFGWNRKMSDEKRENRLLAEINNGRLAMLGIFGFLVADKIPGALPTITGIAKPYSGQPMNPFQVEWGTPFVMVTSNTPSIGQAVVASAAISTTTATATATAAVDSIATDSVVATIAEAALAL